jgi:putative transposase
MPLPNPQYNPRIHHRKSIRLKGYDYSSAGLYFITICCEDMHCRFGKIVNNEMHLNDFGQIAFEEWAKLSDRFPNFELDVFQIMPNHMHAIVLMTDTNAVGAGLAPALENDDDTVGAGFTPALENDDDTVGAGFTPALENDINNNRAGASPAPTEPPMPPPTTLGDIVGSYKSLVANRCLEIFKSKNERMGKFWQRNYYEHIIRNQESYKTIAGYIINNPFNWKDDKFYT